MDIRDYTYEDYKADIPDGSYKGYERFIWVARAISDQKPIRPKSAKTDESLITGFFGHST